LPGIVDVFGLVDNTNEAGVVWVIQVVRYSVLPKDAPTVGETGVAGDTYRLALVNGSYIANTWKPSANLLTNPDVYVMMLSFRYQFN